MTPERMEEIRASFKAALPSIAAGDETMIQVWHEEAIRQAIEAQNLFVEKEGAAK